MKTFKTELSKANRFAICLLLTFTLLLVFPFSTVSEYITRSEVQMHEEKIYCNVTIDDDFDDSYVIVIMDKYIGGINKVHEESFFGDFPKKSITDLTYITGDINSKEFLDKENFHQILKIELMEKSKQNVIDAIRQLEKIDGILSAEPNYYFKLD